MKISDDFQVGYISGCLTVIALYTVCLYLGIN